MIFSSLINLIYPPRCAVCTELLEMGTEGSLCMKCRENFEKNNLCGIIVKHRNDKGIKNTDYLTCGYAVFEYEDIKKSIEHFKFKGFKNDGIALGEIMYQVAKQNFSNVIMEADLLVPVPVHAKRLKERGFNQTQVLAQRFAELSGMCCSDVIKRVRHTVPQSGLHPDQRLENIKDAFECRDDSKIRGKKIIIVDDIFTTGATINECARILRANGAGQVDFFTLSVASLNSMSRE